MRRITDETWIYWMRQYGFCHYRRHFRERDRRQGDITASTKSEESAAKIKEKLGIACGTDNRKTAETSDIVFLAVKPQFLEEVIAEIKDVLCSSQLIISIAAGKTMDWLEEQ